MHEPLGPRRRRLRLEPQAYRSLWRRILERDGWRCQDCGITTDLQVHHIVPRGRGGADVEQNLITLCASCHRRLHSHRS